MNSLDADRVRANVARVQERIVFACERAGRDPAEVDLLAATKYLSVEQLGVLAEAGIGLVGENIANDLAEKHSRWGDRFTFDFIGHLQSRKTKQILPLVRLIHSVESESVLRQIDRHAPDRQRVLLEVNVGREATKYGLDPNAVDGFLELAAGCDNVAFAGLMTMPPAVDDPDRARPYFTELRELAARLDRDWGPRHEFGILSMGTSQDFEAAVEEGATVLRLGNVLYA
jgi:PLP dependent protein